MSAITGIFLRNGAQVDFKSIKKMNDRLSHRGPDGSGVFIDGPVALGHQMLYTTPESLNEKLPFKDETSGIVITADARIDNRDELAPLLNLKNSVQEPDSLFILKAYQKWGEMCPEKLLGDFAFAIWDPLSEQIFCSRDHMGVKTFSYFLSKDVFYFSTEIKAFRNLNDVAFQLNELKIANYLIGNVRDQKSTFFEHIVNLPAAHSIKIDHRGCEIKKYWVLDPELEITMESDKDYVATFREIFSEAVSCRLRSAFPIGFLLSGGLDSTSIVCMAKKIFNQKNSYFKDINTISYVSNDLPQIDESYYINQVVNTGGIKPIFFSADNISPLENMETCLWYLEQPTLSSHVSIYWNLYRIMQKEKNIRILLNGDAGDAIGFSGRNYLRDLLVTFRWKKLVNEADYYSKRVNSNIISTVINQAFYPLLPNLAKKCAKSIRKKERTNTIFNKDFAMKFGGEEHLKELFMSPLEPLKTSRQNHYFSLAKRSMDFTRIHDRVGAAFSIEPRFPYLDKRLIEFSYAIPNDMKFRFGWDRYLHRVAMTDIIPKKNQWRSLKTNYNPWIERNLLLFERNNLEKIINSNNGIIKDYFDLDVLKSIYQNYETGNTDREYLYLWNATTLHFWLQNNDF